MDFPGQASSLQHEHALFVEPGTFSNIQVTQNLYHRKPPPHGDCRKNGSVEDDIKAGRVLPTITRSACESLCVEKQIVDKCSCKDAHMMHLLSRNQLALAEQYPFCEDIGAPMNTWLARVQCMKEVRNVAMVSCSKICKPPCTERTYNTQFSKSKWPLATAMPAFFKKYIWNKPYSHQYKNKSEWMETPQTHLVTKNFLYLYVQSSDTLISTYSEEVTISFSNFLSRLGGSLNLWCGITIIVLMEILEMVYKIVKYTVTIKKQKSAKVSDNR